MSFLRLGSDWCGLSDHLDRGGSRGVTGTDLFLKSLERYQLIRDSVNFLTCEYRNRFLSRSPVYRDLSVRDWTDREVHVRVQGLVFCSSRLGGNRFGTVVTEFEDVESGDSVIVYNNYV